MSESLKDKALSSERTEIMELILKILMAIAEQKGIDVSKL